MFRFNVSFILNGMRREERVTAASGGYARMSVESKYPGAVVVEILGVSPPPAREERKSREDVAVEEKKEARVWTVTASRNARGRIRELS